MGKKGTIQVGVTTASGKYVTRRFLSSKDARDWQEAERAKRQRVLAGLDLPKKLKSMTLQQYAVEHYIARRMKGEVIGKARGKKRQPAVRGTWENEAQRLEDYVIPRMGGRPLGTISSEEWELVFDQIQANPMKKEVGRLSDSTMNKIRALMSRLYEDAIIEGYAIRNPIRDTATRDEGDPQKKSDYWNRDECVRYLAEAKKISPQFFCWAVWALNTGGRINELLATTHDDVNLREGFISIAKIVDIHDANTVRERTKGKRSRIVGMNNSMIDAYLRLRDSLDRYHSDEFLFAHEPGQPGKYHWYYKLHRRACDRARVKYIRPHDLRHTYGSHYMMAGGSLADLGEVLGHKSPSMTQRYAKFSREHLQKTSQVFEVGLETEKKK